MPPGPLSPPLSGNYPVIPLQTIRAFDTLFIVEEWPRKSPPWTKVSAETCQTLLRAGRTASHSRHLPMENLMDFLNPSLFPPIERIELDVLGESIRCVMWADGDRHMQETFQVRDPRRMQHLLASIELMLAPQLGHDTDAILERHRQAGVYDDGQGEQLREEPQVRGGDLTGTGRGAAGVHDAAQDPDRGAGGADRAGEPGGPA